MSIRKKNLIIIGKTSESDLDGFIIKTPVLKKVINAIFLYYYFIFRIKAKNAEV